ncbi:MAG: Stp1/IreP family PP2C-type Ser/Thr phosphatase [Anaerolineae bacterium]|nr:Stp1/IreP family PP2C-type Ser/Thr phosphatase [Anaerolineae bacterium]
MDLFRKMFGKTSEEATEKEAPKATAIETPQSPVLKVEALIEPDGIDPTTQPVSVPPPKSKAQPAPRQLNDNVTQQLASDMLTTTNSSCITFGQSSDIGLVRSNNQDAAMSFFFTSATADDRPDFGIFIVADGMGGHHDGEKASAIAAKTVTTHLTQNVYIPILGGNADIPPISEVMVTAVQKANNDIIKHVPEGGTTVTAVGVLGDLAYIAHVGDSRAYLITKDNIEQITRDHSLVQRLIELDQITQDEVHDHPQKNVLYRALGQNDNVEVDISTRRLPPNSRILICSDGLWGLVAEKDLFEIAMNHSDPQQACEKLVALANTNGGTDNITAIILKIS